jgi:hypothetical protein
MGIGQEAKGGEDKSIYCGFLRRKWARQGKQMQDWSVEFFQ